MEKEKIKQNLNEDQQDETSVKNDHWTNIKKYYHLTLRRTVWLTALIFLFQIILLLPILLIQSETTNKVFYLCHSFITNLLLIFIIFLINHRKIMFIAIYQIDLKTGTLKTNNWLYYIFTFLLAIIFLILTTASYSLVKHINYFEALKMTWWLSILTSLWILICASLNHGICKYLIKENLHKN